MVVTGQITFIMWKILSHLKVAGCSKIFPNTAD